MSHLLIGAVFTAGFFLLLNKIRKHNIRLTWWQWILTVLGFLYATFVFENKKIFYSAVGNEDLRQSIIRIKEAI